MPGSGGLEFPGDVYSLLGNLYTATGRLPQLLTQVTGFLDDWKASGQLGASDGDDASVQVARAAYALGNADVAARQLTASLQAAQNALASVRVEADPDE